MNKKPYEERVGQNFWTKSNFGKRGWGLAGYMAIMLFFCSGTTADGLNILIPQIVAERGWDYARILSYSTISGLVGVVGMFVLGHVAHKKGARFLSVLCLIIAGVSFIWYGNATSEMQYLIALSLLTTFIMGAAWIAGPAYITAWFPRKKGLALGWATMGTNFATVLFAPFLLFSIAAMGVGKTTMLIGALMILISAFAKFFTNQPQDSNCTPDNLPMTDDEIADYQKEANSYESPWTIARLLRTKEMWITSIIIGISMMATTGVISQLVVRLMGSDIGMEQGTAVMALSIAAAIGIPGSYFFGWLDSKITTKKAVIIYMFVFATGIFLNTTSNIILVYISLALIGSCLGGNSNWPGALTSTMFGSKNFTKIYTIVNPIFTCIRVLSFSVLAIAMSLTGSLKGAYILFAVLCLIGAGLMALANDKKYADGTIK